MKKRISLLLVVILIFSMFSVYAVNDETGNGAPSGGHFNLNLIGIEDKVKNMDVGSGHVIFVRMGDIRKTKIMLTEGDFEVLDKNGTDGEAAFQLPNPDPENDGVTEYSVYVRVLGKPGGTGTITTGAEDKDGYVHMSIFPLPLERKSGKQTFVNASKELLYIYADIDEGGLKRYPLFDKRLENYFWEYDNNGLKLVQLRFYPVETVVPDPEDL